MRSSYPRAMLTWAFLLVTLACAGDMPPAGPLGELVHPDQPFSPIRYQDRDLVSLNDRCPVSQTKLSPSIEPIYVNGRPVGFC